MREEDYKLKQKLTERTNRDDKVSGSGKDMNISNFKNKPGVDELNASIARDESEVRTNNEQLGDINNLWKFRKLLHHGISDVLIRDQTIHIKNMTYIKTGLQAPELWLIIILQKQHRNCAVKSCTHCCSGHRHYRRESREMIAAYVSHLNNCDFVIILTVPQQQHIWRTMAKPWSKFLEVRIRPLFPKKVKSIIENCFRVQSGGKQCFGWHRSMKQAGATDEKSTTPSLLLLRFACSTGMWMDWEQFRCKHEYAEMGGADEKGYKLPPWIIRKLITSKNEN